MKRGLFKVDGTTNYIGERAGAAATCEDDDWGATGPRAAPELNSSTMDRWGLMRRASQRSGKNTPARVQGLINKDII